MGGIWGFISVVGGIVNVDFTQETGFWIGIFRIPPGDGSTISNEYVRPPKSTEPVHCLENNPKHSIVSKNSVGQLQVRFEFAKLHRFHVV